MSIILESVNESKDSRIYSVREKELIYKLRTMLKDVPTDVARTLNTLLEEQRGERWTDMQLLIYLEQALSDINCEPAVSSFILDDFPPAWESLVIKGGLIFALIAEGIFQAGVIVRLYSQQVVILVCKSL